MQAEIEQTGTTAMVETISETGFKNLCDEIYRDRLKIYGFRPAAARGEALLWMLLGCLISLLSVTHDELSSLADPSSTDPYGDAICALLQTRARPPFDSRLYVEELKRRAMSEAD